MINPDHDTLKSAIERSKINQHRCIVCGAPHPTLRGHLFYQTGRSRFGAPFCKEHAAHFPEYAHPVFENPKALGLFRFMFPKNYQRGVEGKQILYFDTYKHKPVERHSKQ